MNAVFFKKLGCYLAIGAEATAKGIVVGSVAVGRAAVVSSKAISKATVEVGGSFKEEWNRQSNKKEGV
jgi:hypothetical protein